MCVCMCVCLVCVSVCVYVFTVYTSLTFSIILNIYFETAIAKPNVIYERYILYII